MRAFPEGLYRLAVKDLQGQPAPFLFARRDESTAALMQIVLTFQNLDGQGRWIALTNLTVRGAPGAGQAYQRSEIELLDPEASRSMFIDGDNTVLAANVTAWRKVDEPPIIPWGWQIRTTVTFSAGALANVATLSQVGFLIPRGSLIA